MLNLVCILGLDSKMWPNKKCNFPNWLDRTSLYRTINGSHQLKFAGESKIVISKLTEATGAFQTHLDIQCVEETVHNASDGWFVAESFVIKDW